MLEFLKSKKQRQREHVRELVEWHEKTLVRCRDNILRYAAAGNIELVSRNHESRLRALTDLALLQWRQRIDPRETIADLAEYYPQAKRFFAECDPEKPLYFFDTDLMVTLTWLSGLETDVSPDTNSQAPFFYGCSNYLLRVAMGLEVPPNQSNAFQATIFSNDSLPYRILQDISKVLGLIKTDQTLDEIVRSAEANWNARATSPFFENHSGTTSGYGNTNYLYLDFYLAAALHRAGWRGDTIHQWVW